LEEEQDKLLAEYADAEIRFLDVGNKVDKWFMPKVREAISQGQMAEARQIAEIIPDHIVKCFACDAIRQAEGRYEQGTDEAF
jgi:hypothetical protein